LEKVFASWSGGKDCCLALYRARQNGMDVRYLANTVRENGTRSCSHGISSAVIREQSKALGIPIVQQPTLNDNYESQFIKMIQAFREEGIEGGVFGDIDFNEHREWIERVCAVAGITPHLPLWLEDQKKLVEEFIDAGFESVIVAAKAELFDKDVLGRKIDRDFLSYINELKKTMDITPCGEAGEYHSLVIDGPIFKKRLELVDTEKVQRDQHIYLEVKRTELRDK
jgi:diphthine-ammonia ligase